MHSRIFQISSKPIDRDDYITDDRYYNSFVGYIADYVSTVSDSDIKDELKWLKSALGNSAKFSDDLRSFVIIDKQEYFKYSYDRFIELLDKLRNTTFKEFCDESVFYSDGYGNTSLDLLFEHLKCAYDDKFSFYFDDNDEYSGLMTINGFMRKCSDGDMFYTGAVIDYHF